MRNQKEIPGIPPEKPKTDPQNPPGPELPSIPPEREFSPEIPVTKPKDPPVIIPKEK